MLFLVTAAEKAESVRSLALSMPQEVRIGRRRVQESLLRSFCGTWMPLSLAMALERLYTRELYWDLCGPQSSEERGRVQLTHRTVRYVRFWSPGCDRSDEDDDASVAPEASIHSDGEDMRYGGALHTKNMKE